MSEYIRLLQFTGGVARRHVGPPAWTHFVVPVIATDPSPLLSFEMDVRVGHIYLDGVGVAPAAAAVL
jgi:hypothetical protein